jgi:hypothetical protein
MIAGLLFLIVGMSPICASTIDTYSVQNDTLHTEKQQVVPYKSIMEQRIHAMQVHQANMEQKFRDIMMDKYAYEPTIIDIIMNYTHGFILIMIAYSIPIYVCIIMCGLINRCFR